MTDVLSDPRMARAVPVPMIRPDAVLRFTWPDLIKVSRAVVGDDLRTRPPAPVRPWLEILIERMQAGDVELIVTALSAGLKAGDGFTALPLPDAVDPRFAPAEVMGPVVDALSLSMYGGTLEQLVARREAEAAADSVKSEPPKVEEPG